MWFTTTEDLNNFCLKSSEGSLQSVIFGNMPRTTSFFHYNSDVMTTFFNGRWHQSIRIKKNKIKNFRINCVLEPSILLTNLSNRSDHLYLKIAIKYQFQCLLTDTCPIYEFIIQIHLRCLIDLNCLDFKHLLALRSHWRKECPKGQNNSET